MDADTTMLVIKRDVLHMRLFCAYVCEKLGWAALGNPLTEEERAQMEALSPDDCRFYLGAMMELVWEHDQRQHRRDEGDGGEEDTPRRRQRPERQRAPGGDFSVSEWAADHDLDPKAVRRKLRAMGKSGPYTLADIEEMVRG